MFRNPIICNCIVFENHFKSLILQDCERSELNLKKMCQIVDISLINLDHFGIFLTIFSSPYIFGTTLA